MKYYNITTNNSVTYYSHFRVRRELMADVTSMKSWEPPPARALESTAANNNV